MKRRTMPVKQFVAGGVQTPAKNGSISVPPKSQGATPVRNYSFQKAIPNVPTADALPKPLVEVKSEADVVEEQPAAVAQPVDVEDEPMATDDGQKRKMLFKKIFLHRKKSSVRARERKLRTNRQLRKIISPKNALMALHEVKGIQITDFVINSHAQGGYSACVTVNGKEYEGVAVSKAGAKMNACEKALRDLVLEKLRQNPKRPISRNSVERMDTSETNENEAGEQAEADEVPMINLASFAIYKLFNTWKDEGFEIPEMHATGQTSNGDGQQSDEGKEPKKLPIRTELPPDWENYHPTTLICIMRPGITFIDLGMEGELPNAIQRIGLEIEGNKYVGQARNKKVARRNAAVEALNDKYGTNFVIEQLPPVVAPAAAATAANEEL